MSDLPEIVQATLDKLKNLFPFPLQVKKIYNYYYVYFEFGVTSMVKTLGKRYITIDIGKIDEKTGEFIKTDKTIDDFMEFFKKALIAKGYKITEPDIEELKKGAPTENDMKVVKALSMNARLDAGEIAKLMNMNVHSVAKSINKIKRLYNPKYTVYLDLRNSNFAEFISLIKFESKIPSDEEINDALINDPHVQCVFRLNGNYDLLTYHIEDKLDFKEGGRGDYIYDILAKAEPLNLYNFNIASSSIVFSHGFFPLRDLFFEKMMSKRIWHRKKYGMARQEHELTEHMYNVLRTLNENSKLEFKKIAEKFGVSNDTAKYNYQLLLLEQFIKRPTIVLNKIPGLKYISMIDLEITNPGEFDQSLKDFFMIVNQDDDKLIINKILHVVYLSNLFRYLIFIPVFHDYDVESIVDEIRDKVKGIGSITTSTITEQIIGYIPLRKYDMNNSSFSIELEKFGIKSNEIKYMGGYDYIDIVREHMIGTPRKEIEELLKRFIK